MSSMQELVHQLESAGIIRSEIVKIAMTYVDRKNYVPVPWLDPYDDTPQPIGYGATISAPHMHATVLELLKDRLFEGARVLDVGSGSGYLTACMGLMVGPNGLVVGIDHIGQLVELSKSNIQRDNPVLFVWGTVVLVEGDGRSGYPEYAPYDAIHVGASSEEYPKTLVDQLAPGGRLVAPVGGIRRYQYLEQIDKHMNGEVTRTRLMAVRFVPLTERNTQLRRTSIQFIG